MTVSIGNGVDLGNLVTSQTNPLTGGVELVAGGVVIPTIAQSYGYFAHCYASNQLASDGKFFDLLAMSDGTFGANLSKAQAWGNAGFVSTLDPASGTLDTGIAFPALAWDWQAGESLLLFWRGIVTPEGANTSIMGQSFSASQKGPQFRALATGQADIVFRGGDGSTSMFIGSTPNTIGLKPFVAGEEHSFAIACDPVARVNKWYVDGEFVAQNTMAAFDTYNGTNPFRLGSAAQSVTASDGLATATRALVILKGRVNKPLPEDIATTIRRLHRQPWRLLSNEAW